MEFSINDNIMGSDFSTSGPLKLSAYIVGKTDNLRVDVLRDNQEIYSETTENGLIEIDLDDIPEAGDHFYYLRVTQENDEKAWSTPIWVKAT